MRLRILHDGHRPRQRMALRMIRWTSGTAPDPVVATMLYRPDLFGRAFSRFLVAVMRGPSEWSAGERELFAAFVSRLNSCPFCAGIHSGMVEHNLADGMLERLDNWRDGTLPPRLSTTLGLLEKVTLHADDVGAQDIAAVRETGVSDEAIRQALYVCSVFNIINRVANALDFGWETEADRLKLVKGLHRVQYRVPSFLLG